MTTKDMLHQLVNELPETASVPAVQILEYLRDDPEVVRRFLEEIKDPVLRALRSAPIDDELETDEERAAVTEAREDYKAGRVVSHEEMLGEFGAG